MCMHIYMHIQCLYNSVNDSSSKLDILAQLIFLLPDNLFCLIRLKVNTFLNVICCTRNEQIENNYSEVKAVELGLTQFCVFVGVIEVFICA